MQYVSNKVPKIGPRYSRKPQEDYYLSGVVLIVNKGIGFSYVKFDDRLVHFLGKKMPYGIGPSDPAYLKVVHRGGHYDVLCCYVDKSHSVVLWKEDKLPEWVREVRYADKSKEESGRKPREKGNGEPRTKCRRPNNIKIQGSYKKPTYSNKVSLR